MALFISLCLAVPLAWFGGKIIKKWANICYLLSALISFGMIVLTHSGRVNDFPLWFVDYIWPIFANCALATALFILVMMTGALPRGSAAIKRLMPIRAELSILASILTLGHNLSYGKTYFVMLFTSPERLSGELLWAAICSVVMLLVMIPLMVTSFPAVRKKMKAKAWKRLQRCAYVFYALIYVHVMLLATSFLAVGRKEYLLNVLLYSLVFITYAVMRIRKAMLKRFPMGAKLVPAVLAVAVAALALWISIPNLLPEESRAGAQSTEQSTGAETVPTDQEATANTRLQTESEESEPNQTSAAPPEDTSLATEPSSETTYTDGTYFGTGKGFVGDIQVAVTIKDGQLSSVIVVSNSDDKAYFDQAKTILDTMIQNQSTDVDAVSGATYSSQGLVEAVENALTQAKSDG